MSEARRTLNRLRRMLGVDDRVVMEFDHVLPQHFPIMICILPDLCTTSVAWWFGQRQLPLPKGVRAQGNVNLHGGIIARGDGAIIFLNGTDDPDERRFSLAHEAGHFLSNHYFPRRDVALKLGPAALEIVDGRRAPSEDERVDAILQRTSLSLHVHLSNTMGGSSGHAEAHADAFALEALAPRKSVLSLLPGLTATRREVQRTISILGERFRLPAEAAEIYAGRLCAQYGRRMTLHERFDV